MKLISKIIKYSALFLIVFLFSGCSMINMMKKFNSGTPDFTKDICVVPFELYEHTMYVNVKVNDYPDYFNFIFDTGAMTMVDKKVAAKLNLTKLSDLPGGDVDAYLLKEKCEIRLDDVGVKDFIIPAFDMPEAEEGEPEIHGFIGSDFCQFFVVTIDYTKKEMTFRKNLDDISGLESALEIPVELFEPLKFPMAQCTIEDSFQINSMLDTGSPFGMVLPLSLLEKEDFKLEGELIEAEGNIIKWPFTKNQKNYLTRIKSLKIGSYEINNYPVIFADLPMNMKNPLIGKEILDQFIITIDYPNEKMFLQPIETPNFKDNIFTTGLAVKDDEDGKIFVKGFWKGSPAEKNNIKIGDEIIRVNSVAIEDIKNNLAKDYLDNPDVPEIELIIKREQEELSILLKKENMFK